ncbi:hypothetical protein [Paraburkholderia rhynchosiae]|nr:hypothetical protein [Paraburkholderia rhynchosiae]
MSTIGTIATLVCLSPNPTSGDGAMQQLLMDKRSREKRQIQVVLSLCG